MRVKYTSLITILLCIYTINIPYLSQTANNLMNLFLIILIMGVMAIKRYIKRRDFNPYAVVFLIVSCLSTAINLGISSRFVNAVTTNMGYLLLVSGFYICFKHASVEKTMKLIWKFLLFELLVVDVFILVTHGKGYGGSGVLAYYLIGNKFAVSYTHMLFLAVMLYQLRRERTKCVSVTMSIIYSAMSIIYSAISIFICHYVNCNTGMIGCLAIVVLYFISHSIGFIYKLMSKWSIFLVVFCGLTFLLVGTDYLISSPFLQNIIKNILHRDLTLVGRIDMYRITINAIQEHPILGHGINSTYVSQVLSFGNAQNGILKMILDYGIVGLVAFLLLCKSCLQNIKNENAIRESLSIVTYLYGMAICSMVEINISALFMMGLGIVYGMNRINIETIEMDRGK